MQNKWKQAAAELQWLADSYSAEKLLPPSEIHQEILIRALKLLGEVSPQAEALIRPNLGIMLPYTIIADVKGDRENGAGSRSARRRRPVGRYSAETAQEGRRRLLDGHAAHS